MAATMLIAVLGVCVEGRVKTSGGMWTALAGLLVRTGTQRVSKQQGKRHEAEEPGGAAAWYEGAGEGLPHLQTVQPEPTRTGGRWPCSQAGGHENPVGPTDRDPAFQTLPKCEEPLGVHLLSAVMAVHRGPQE
jgi:hypothetical protein